MDLRAADYFLAIAETGSINRAAEKLYISEPALSQYLKRLENELDVTLILRSQNSVLTLTQAGVCFRDYCLAATKLQREMRWDLAQIRTQKKKRLRIGCSPSDPGTWLPGPRIEAFLALSQEIDIVFDTAQALEKRLLNRELDLFFGAVDPKNPALSYTILHSRELDLCVSVKHPLILLPDSGKLGCADHAGRCRVLSLCSFWNRHRCPHSLRCIFPCTRLHTGQGTAVPGHRRRQTPVDHRQCCRLSAAAGSGIGSSCSNCTQSANLLPDGHSLAEG